RSVKRRITQRTTIAGHRESRPGFRARATFFLAHSFFVRLEKLVSSPRPMLVNGRRAQGRSRTRTCAPVRALSLTDPSTPADLGRAWATTCNDLGIGLLSVNGKRPLNLISGRLVLEPNPYPTCWGRKRPGGWTGPIFWLALKP